MKLGTLAVSGVASAVRSVRARVGGEASTVTGSTVSSAAGLGSEPTLLEPDPLAFGEDDEDRTMVMVVPIVDE